MKWTTILVSDIVGVKSNTCVGYMYTLYIKIAIGPNKAQLSDSVKLKVLGHNAIKESLGLMCIVKAQDRLPKKGGELGFKHISKWNAQFKTLCTILQMNKFFKCMLMIDNKCKDNKYKEYRDRESKHKNLLSRFG